MLPREGERFRCVLYFSGGGLQLNGPENSRPLEVVVHEKRSRQMSPSWKTMIKRSIWNEADDEKIVSRIINHLQIEPFMFLIEKKRERYEGGRGGENGADKVRKNSSAEQNALASAGFSPRCQWSKDKTCDEKELFSFILAEGTNAKSGEIHVVMC